MSVSLQERARELYASGAFGHRQIAKELGVSPSTALRYVNPALAERGRKLSSAAKQRRRGTCESCGAETRYNGHGRGTSERCLACAYKRQALAKRGQGETVGMVLTALAERPHRFTEIRDLLPVGSYTPTLINRLLRYGLIERRERGVYALAIQPSESDDERN
ncbi:MAG: helix-turn-helix domain-containing protein [Actinobacteria bacterium]|nr:helix-turn-helix domain-containing protein [Actinomycetota bacterium]